tara:strand:- start:243 stop:443 length:201 start_codon:yes stop_codon:yes gene_type:complete
MLGNRNKEKLDSFHGDLNEDGNMENITEAVQQFTMIYQAHAEVMSDHLEGITKALCEISNQLYRMK